MFISPGLRLTVENWATYVSVGIPAVNDSNGIQPTSNWRVFAGVSAVFGAALAPWDLVSGFLA
jgi:hypothetical protein